MLTNDELNDITFDILCYTDIMRECFKRNDLDAMFSYAQEIIDRANDLLKEKLDEPKKA